MRPPAIEPARCALCRREIAGPTARTTDGAPAHPRCVDPIVYVCRFCGDRTCDPFLDAPPPPACCYCPVCIQGTTDADRARLRREYDEAVEELNAAQAKGNDDDDDPPELNDRCTAPHTEWCALVPARCHPVRWFAGFDAGWCAELDPWTYPHCYPEGTFAHPAELDE